MNDLFKRFFTSIALLIVLYSSMINHYILLFLFNLIAFIVMIEAYRLIKLIFKKKFFLMDSSVGHYSGAFT